MNAKEQREAFKREAQKRLDAGQLSPADADAAMDSLIRKSIRDHGA